MIVVISYLTKLTKQNNVGISLPHKLDHVYSNHLNKLFDETDMQAVLRWNF